MPALTPEQQRLKDLFAGNPLANRQAIQPEIPQQEEQQPQYQADVTQQMSSVPDLPDNNNAYQQAIQNRFGAITSLSRVPTTVALQDAQQRAAQKYADSQKVSQLGTPSNQGMQYASPNDANTGSNKRNMVLDLARAQIGLPYAWGGGTKKGASYGIGRGTSNLKGFDCSGLTLYAYSKIGINMSHSAGAQARMGVRMPINKLSPGDLVGAPGHIAIYAGNGMMYEAPTFGKKVRYVPVRKGMFGVHLNY